MFHWFLNTPQLKYLLKWRLVFFSLTCKMLTKFQLGKFPFSTSWCSMKLKLTLRICINKYTWFVTLSTCSLWLYLKRFSDLWITPKPHGQGDDSIYCLLFSKPIIYHIWGWRVGVRHLSTNSVCKRFAWFLLIEGIIWRIIV